MKVIDKTKKTDIPTIAHHLSELLPSEMILYPVNDYGAGSNFVQMIARKPTESFDKLDGFGPVIGGILEKDANHIVIYDKAHLPMIKRLVESYESLYEGTEITVEIRPWNRKDYFRMPRDRM